MAILAEAYREQGWWTTADVADALERSKRGARWIVDQAAIACDRTTRGYRLFRESDVLRLVDRRAQARRRSVTALRPKKIGARGGPKQLTLFAGHRRG